MNIFRPQRPYVFRPPKYSPALSPALRMICHGFLRHRFKVSDFTARGGDRVAELVKDRHAVLVAPNHADHADPSLLVMVGRRHRLAFHFMAAREGFERDRLTRFLLQRLGAFSVDREGADIASVKTAIGVLQDGRHPLVIFPEGEIYHHHERLDALNEGVATIVLRAAARLKDGRRAFVVPTALRFTYDPSVERTFAPRLDRLERRIAWKPRPDLDPVERIYRLGGGLLALKEQEYLGRSHDGTLLDRIVTLQHRLVAMIEQKHETEPDGTLPERIRTLRRVIRRELTNTEQPPTEERSDALYDDLETVFVAAQLYSYPGQYLREQPTVDRIAETIFKLEEDLLEQCYYGTPRAASVVFGDPIDVAELLEQHGLAAKTGAPTLTGLLRERLEGLMG